MRGYVTAAELRTIASAVRETAGFFGGRSQVFGDDVEVADYAIGVMREYWGGPRADHDLLRFCKYVNDIRGMTGASTAVALTLYAIANDADRIAGFLYAHEATLAAARAETPAGESLPNEAWLAQRAIEQLDLDWNEACGRHERAVTKACEPFEQANAAFVGEFWPPVMSQSAYVAALVEIAGLQSLDLEWLGYTDEEVRRWLEAGHEETEGDALVAAVMQGATPAAAVAYWNTLTDTERRVLTRDRPDLAAKVLAGGGTLTESELFALDRANSYPVFSDEMVVAYELSAGARVVRVELGGEFVLVAMKMSDGTVQVAIGRKSQAGVGAEATTLHGDIELAAGVFAAADTVFVFANEADAAEAISGLQTEVQNSLDDFLVNAAVVVDNLIPPYTPPTWPLLLPNELEEMIDELWSGYGMMRTGSGGAYANVEADLETAQILTEMEAEVTVSVYATETTDLTDDPARSGIIVSGSLRAEGDSAGTEGVTDGAAGEGEGSFTVDAYTTEDGERFITVTVQGSLTGGVLSAVDWAHGPVALDVDVSTQAGLEATVEVTVQLDDADSGNHVVGIVEALTDGEGLDAALAFATGDQQDISVVVDAIVVVEGDLQVDAGTAEFDAEETLTTRRNVVNLHQFPGGEQYSRIEVDAMIAEQLGEEPAEAEPVLIEDAELTDAEFHEQVMGSSGPAWLEPPEDGTRIHLVDADELATGSSEPATLDLDKFPSRDDATSRDYAAVIEAYGSEAMVAYDEDGAALYIETENGEFVELNDSGFPRQPVSTAD